VESRHVQTFSLVPFPASRLPKINVNGEVSRVENQLSIHYEVTGDIDQILLPVQCSLPSRKDDLWKATCFEFFLAVPDQPRYREFNMSPSGAWNVYVMDKYRRVGFREESEIAQYPFEFTKSNKRISLVTSMDLTPVLSPSQNIQLSITAIIQTKDENETYWALAHPGQQADFHLRESFILSL